MLSFLEGDICLLSFVRNQIIFSYSFFLRVLLLTTVDSLSSSSIFGKSEVCGLFGFRVLLEHETRKNTKIRNVFN